MGRGARFPWPAARPGAVRLLHALDVVGADLSAPAAFISTREETAAAAGRPDGPHAGQN